MCVCETADKCDVMLNVMRLNVKNRNAAQYICIIDCKDISIDNLLTDKITVIFVQKYWDYDVSVLCCVHTLIITDSLYIFIKVFMLHHSFTENRVKI